MTFFSSFGAARPQDAADLLVGQCLLHLSLFLLSKTKIEINLNYNYVLLNPIKGEWRIYQPTSTVGLSSTKVGAETNKTDTAIEACCWVVLVVCHHILKSLLWLKLQNVEASLSG